MSNLKGKKHIGTYDNLGEGYFLSDQLNVLPIKPNMTLYFPVISLSSTYSVHLVYMKSEIQNNPLYNEMDCQRTY